MGFHVIEGLVSMEIKHAAHWRHARVFKRNAFLFKDTSIPRVIRIESTDDVAIDVLRVPKSEPTEFKVIVEKAPASVQDEDLTALVGASPQPIIFTTRNVQTKIAQVILTAPASNS